MYESIVVGTDGSANAERAVDAAAHLALPGGVVHVVHVTQDADPSLAEIASHLPMDLKERFDPEIVTAARLASAKTIIDRAGAKYVGHASSGDPADAILDVAEDEYADLVVVGSRGLNPATRFKRGSVSTKVAQTAACSVLVIQE